MRRKECFCSYRKQGTQIIEEYRKERNKGTSREKSQVTHGFCVGEFKYKWSDCCVFLSRCVLQRKESHFLQFYYINVVVCSSLTFLWENISCFSRLKSQFSVLFPHFRPVFWSPYAHLLFSKVSEWIVHSSIFHLKSLLLKRESLEYQNYLQIQDTFSE